MSDFVNAHRALNIAERSAAIRKGTKRNVKEVDESGAATLDWTGLSFPSHGMRLETEDEDPLRVYQGPSLERDEGDGEVSIIRLRQGLIEMSLTRQGTRNEEDQGGSTLDARGLPFSGMGKG